ncbi:MAG: DUF1080 domain-containing protein [Bacteroidales bacterium]|nr:DUF1080 domain-containing protein [Bacteroidales bacterium]
MKKLLYPLLSLLLISCNAFTQNSETKDPLVGDWQVSDGQYFAKVYLTPEGIYRVALTKDLTSRKVPEAILTGEKADDNVLQLSGEGWTGQIKDGKLEVSNGIEKLKMEHFHRTSPTYNATPPPEAIVLFDGKNLDSWTKVMEKDWLVGGTPADNWKIVDGGFLEVVPHPAGEYESIITRKTFGDIRLHIEFRLLGPETNGGVYLMSRYELNIKDAYSQINGTPIGFGNIADPKDLYPDFNVAFPPMEWQTFDIDFRAPRFDVSGTNKTENARIAVVHNGVPIYNDIEIKAVKGSASRLGEAPMGPIYLQEHGVPYQFRNIWVLDKTRSGSPESKIIGNGHSNNKNTDNKRGNGGKNVYASYLEELNPAYADTLVDLTANSTGIPAPPNGFKHPGVLVTKGQLDEIKRRVKKRIEPQYTAFRELEASRYADLNYNPKPIDTVRCGPRSNPNIGCKDEQSDCAAAYSQALLWIITGNNAYAEKAIEIMNAWSYTLVGGHKYANGPIQAAWCGAVWPRAAEIIRYTYDAWSDEDIVKFQNMLRLHYVPSIMHGDCENGNKELAMCDALVNIGVFLDDRDIFDLGLKIWRTRAPAYIYLKNDGPTPIEPVGCGPAIWGNKGLTPEFVDGLLQETARDSHHACYGFASMTNAAETAYHQGVGLYEEQAVRMMAAIEFQAQFLAPNKTPVPENLSFALQPTWEIAFNHFQNRLGYTLPKMAAVIPTNRPTGVNHYMVWETLTHGAMGTIGITSGANK